MCYVSQRTTENTVECAQGHSSCYLKSTYFCDCVLILTSIVCGTSGTRGHFTVLEVGRLLILLYPSSLPVPLVN
jgi:hypothetical protein